MALGERIRIVLAADVRGIDKQLEALKRRAAAGKKTADAARAQSLTQQVTGRGVGTAFGLGSRVAGTAAAALVSKDILGSIIQDVARATGRLIDQTVGQQIKDIQRVLAKAGIVDAPTAEDFEGKLNGIVDEVRKQVDAGIAAIQSAAGAYTTARDVLTGAQMAGSIDQLTGDTDLLAGVAIADFGSRMLDAQIKDRQDRTGADLTLKAMKAALSRAQGLTQ